MANGNTQIDKLEKLYKSGNLSTEMRSKVESKLVELGRLSVQREGSGVSSPILPQNVAPSQVDLSQVGNQFAVATPNRTLTTIPTSVQSPEVKTPDLSNVPKFQPAPVEKSVGEKVTDFLDLEGLSDQLRTMLNVEEAKDVKNLPDFIDNVESGTKRIIADTPLFLKHGIENPLDTIREAVSFPVQAANDLVLATLPAIETIFTRGRTDFLVSQPRIKEAQDRVLSDPVGVLLGTTILKGLTGKSLTPKQKVKVASENVRKTLEEQGIPKKEAKAVAREFEIQVDKLTGREIVVEKGKTPTPVKPAQTKAQTKTPELPEKLTPTPEQRKQAIGETKVEKFSTGAEEAINDVIVQRGKELREQRRGEVPIAKTKERAAKQKKLVEDAKAGKVKKGSIFNAEEIEALATEIENIGQRIEVSPHGATRVKNNPETINVAKAFFGGATELGRGLRQLRETHTPTFIRSAKVIRDSIDDPTLKKRINRFLDKGELPPPTLMNKIVEFGRNAKLLSASGLFKAFGGNISAQLFKYQELGLQGPINAALSALTGKKRDRFSREIASDIVGMKHGFKDGLDIAWDIFLERESGLEQALLLERELGRTARRAIKGKKGVIIRTPQRLHGMIDATFRIPTFNGLIYRHAMRKALQEGKTGSELFKRRNELIREISKDKELIKPIKNESEYLTFQNELGELGKAVNRLRQAAGGVVQIQVPFFSTMANLFKFYVARTPFALLDAKNFWGPVRRAFKKGEAIGPATDAITRLTSGTAFFSTAAYTVYKLLEGKLHGRGPDDRATLQQYYDMGWLPYSFEGEDDKGKTQFISYQGLEPLSSFMASLADYNEGYKDKGFLGGIQKSVFEVGQAFGDNPFFKGVADIADVFRGRLDREKFFTNIVIGMTIPTLVRQTAAALDPNLRVQDNTLDSFQAVLPFASKRLPKRFTPLGREATRKSPIKSLFGFKATDKTSDPVLLHLEEIGSVIGNPQRYKNVKLSNTEISKINEIAGKVLYKQILMLLNNPSYVNSENKEFQRKLIDNLRDRTFNYHRQLIFGLRGEKLANREESNNEE